MLDQSVSISLEDYKHEVFTERLSTSDTSLSFDHCMFKRCMSNVKPGGCFLFLTDSDKSKLDISNTYFEHCSAPQCGTFSSRSNLVNFTNLCFNSCVASQISTFLIGVVYGDRRPSNNPFHTINGLTFLNCPDVAPVPHICYLTDIIVDPTNLNVTQCQNEEYGTICSLENFTGTYYNFYIINNTGKVAFYLESTSQFTALYFYCTTNSFTGGLFCFKKIPPGGSGAQSLIRLCYFGENAPISEPIDQNYVYQIDRYQFSDESEEIKIKAQNSKVFFTNHYQRTINFGFDMETLGSCIFKIQVPVSDKSDSTGPDRLVLYSLIAAACGIAVGGGVIILIAFLKRRKAVNQWVEQSNEQ